MAVRVRLTRVGSKKNAMWRVVVADQRSPRDGRFIEMIGHYNPQTEPSQIVIDRARLDHWLKLGARPSETVQKLMRAENSPPVTAAAPPAPEPAADSQVDAESASEADAAAGGDAAAEADAGAAEADAGAAEPESEAPEADESSAATEGSDGEASTEAEASGGEEATDEKSG